MSCVGCVSFLCQAEDGIRDLVRSRGLGDVYKRQTLRRVGRLASTVVAKTLFIGNLSYRATAAELVELLSLIHI